MVRTCNPAIIVHGGAWSIPDDAVTASVHGVEKAASVGYEALINGRTALDAVEAAVRNLEDDPIFDAGTGSVLNEDGVVELDSIIMNGKTLSCGAVACVKNIKNPVSLARLVMEKTPHILLVGEGANKFAAQNGVDEVEPEELVTPAAVEEWKRFKQYSQTVDSLFNKSGQRPSDTVGCVAIDKDGNIACGTSTGGITAKRAGRVGDSPIVGCGAYADNAVGGVSTTGHGESIMKVTLARHVLYLMEERKLGPSEAAHAALDYMRTKVDGCGGVIVIDSKGNIGHAFSTKRMAWASYSEGTLASGI
mmetsp:Transcript_37423/g.60593  ORF Transcript_37423/g.60593 Transcript_37423/m.60593 type:complete len:306 (-) Transcript_37423:88-1005(-)|eukprot:CAMPEP_0184656952 /NCGR_PEP_ID=MMETSP0308-20130426/16868_1 /TAXON_ID=38269 /ORGANISM="Gloeochaete witrockiana, Strain SAG 46.84" /LENGTH=305 /DNA_ID=CAMNT_0027094291 /DNA_START=73 /DNA_END=990 /DNA_ORIENTATION=+